MLLVGHLGFEKPISHGDLPCHPSLGTMGSKERASESRSLPCLFFFLGLGLNTFKIPTVTQHTHWFLKV